MKQTPPQRGKKKRMRLASLNFSPVEPSVSVLNEQHHNKTTMVAKQGVGTDEGKQMLSENKEACGGWCGSGEWGLVEAMNHYLFNSWLIWIGVELILFLGVLGGALNKIACGPMVILRSWFVSTSLHFLFF